MLVTGWMMRSPWELMRKVGVVEPGRNTTRALYAAVPAGLSK